MTSGLGFEPVTKMEPSGRQVALEWYNRGMVDAERPSVEKREPAAASGSYMRGWRIGEVAYECPIAQDYAPNQSVKDF